MKTSLLSAVETGRDVNKTIESLSQRIDMKDAALKRQKAEANAIQEELKAKLVTERNQLSAEFKSLHLKLSHQMETMSQDLVATQAQVIAAAKLCVSSTAFVQLVRNLNCSRGVIKYTLQYL